MNVLICDDMETDRASLRKILSEMGHVVEAVTNGDEAVTRAAASQPKAIFLDVVMPKMDGFATCRALKNNAATKSIPVIMVTSKATPADQFWAQQQGAAAHVMKPASPPEISDALRKAGLV